MSAAKSSKPLIEDLDLPIDSPADSFFKDMSDLRTENDLARSTLGTRLSILNSKKKDLRKSIESDFQIKIYEKSRQS